MLGGKAVILIGIVSNYYSTFWSEYRYFTDCLHLLRSTGILVTISSHIPVSSTYCHDDENVDGAITVIDVYMWVYIYVYIYTYI